MDNKPNFKGVAEALEQEVSNLAINLIRRKPKAEREPSRNGLAVIGIAAFVLLAVLDLISAILVGAITNALYGFLTFGIGVGSLVIATVGHFFPYASAKQKLISVVDIILSIASTLLIGILAAIVNAGNYFGVFNSSGLQSVFEIIMLVGLVVIGITHAILFFAYVLVDETVQRNQRNLASRAAHSEHLQTIAMAKERTAATIQLATDLTNMIRQGQGGILRETIINLTGGDDLLGEIPEVVEQVSRQSASRPMPRPMSVPTKPYNPGTDDRVPVGSVGFSDIDFSDNGSDPIKR
jgi:hypothetical protein